jgi:hypothetical protein
MKLWFEDFGGFQITISKKNKCQMFMFKFSMCSQKYITRLLIRTSHLVYSKIWLNLLMDDATRLQSETFLNNDGLTIH